MVLKFLRRFTTGTVALYCVGHTISKHVGELLICSGPSMHPTCQDGELILAERLSVKFDNIQVGDIVGCINPQKPKELLCKRIVGKEGDPITSHLLPSGRVPIGHVFLQGDNTPVSTDSRHFGPVPEGLVQIRLSLRIWPLERAGWVNDRWFWDKSN
ncbi:Protein CBR-IMMP-1 [Caenorhabditis briggsae]|uniref:Peptidase S26 domain-containing protein n=3 Tax=Caenorhabditis TaxID=6237 RepID=A0AAE9IQD5_CAEBR|nr:Protein CBR-IMMP-1 [Caenorhabditis briggsae]ULU00278.1 hypothetical protein L3Y34_001055 [Caenorhabditis briggsae]UMM22954.1 hypothetical protein L5515_003907 [Caenorhabditis briggsae]CAP32044.1 Protein CBR-IMMP-1 [Caenorhabditis briggsae]